MATKVDLKAYFGKRIKFHYTPPKNSADETPRTVEGLVEMVTDSALLIKERGSAMLKLMELSGINLDTVELIVEPPRELKQKTVDPITLSSARNHLLDKHGFELSDINEMPDEDAYQVHLIMDHSNLGHVHEVRP